MNYEYLWKFWIKQLISQQLRKKEKLQKVTSFIKREKYISVRIITSSK